MMGKLDWKAEIHVTNILQNGLSKCNYVLFVSSCDKGNFQFYLDSNDEEVTTFVRE